MPVSFFRPIHRSPGFSTLESAMMNALRSLWAEPRAPKPPPRVGRDWLLVAVLAPTAILEGVLRDDLVWRALSLVLGVALAFTLLWRRTNPLLVVVAAFGSTAVVEVQAGGESSENPGRFSAAQQGGTRCVLNEQEDSGFVLRWVRLAWLSARGR